MKKRGEINRGWLNAADAEQQKGEKDVWPPWLEARCGPCAGPAHLAQGCLHAALLVGAGRVGDGLGGLLLHDHGMLGRQAADAGSRGCCGL